MAAFEPPVYEPPSRKKVREAASKEDRSDIGSRAARNRLRREQSMERRFGWLFVIVVSATTLYLLSRMPWGLVVLHRHF